MKKSILLLISCLLVGVGVACGPAVPATGTPAATTVPNATTVEATAVPDIFPQITITPIKGYPGPQTPESLNPYPGLVLSPTPDPYPAIAGYVWVTQPRGIQCEDPAFSTIAEAAQSLRDAGIDVQGATSLSLPVCAACGCPMSLFYRLQIPEADVQKAAGLGWQRED